jgi:hypothetical protein
LQVHQIKKVGKAVLIVNNLIRRLIVVSVFVLALSACAQTPPPATEVPTDEPTAEVTAELTPEVTAEVTPAADTTSAIEVPPGTADDNSFLSVVRLSEQSAGVFLLDASISNGGDADIEVVEGQIALIDTEGNRYEPAELESNVQPQLIGATLASEETLRGFAQFELPEDATISHMEWCVDTDCETVLGSIIPDIELLDTE